MNTRKIEENRLEGTFLEVEMREVCRGYRNLYVGREQRYRGKNAVFGVRSAEFEYWLYHVLTEWPWASDNLSRSQFL